MHPLEVLSPYPSISAKGELRDGYLMSQSPYCEKKCIDRICRSYHHESDEVNVYFNTCPHGFSVISLSIEDYVFRINGVIETLTNTSTAELKKLRKHRKVKRTEIESWYRAVVEAIPHYQQDIQSTAKDQISALHEIKALIGTLLKTAEDWIYDQDGFKLDQKLENSPDPLKTIYHACRTLEVLLQLTDIVANPQVATFGKPYSANIHAMFYMLKRIFESRAAQKNIRIDLSGSTYSRPVVYRSFFVLPLVIIDNAVKHSFPNSIIKVIFKDNSEQSVTIRIISAGENIPLDEEKAVFKRGVRGSNVSVQGSGLGLFVAKTVANANKAVVLYIRHPAKGSKGTPLNEFKIIASSIE